jgi:hypothetical protein
MRHAVRVTVVAVLVSAGPASAEEPTVSDIAFCNQAADAATGASALPRMPGPRPGLEGTRDSGDRQGAPGAGEAGSPAVTPPPTRGGAPGTETDSTGSIVTRAPDPLLEGMAADKLDDRAYRAAYRQCMERQLGRARR